MWDIAAGMLLVQVAGGRVTNFDGKAWAGVRQGFVASNGKIHNQLLKLVS
jgi:myo-inositol-1(or 4)-monophosphatase